MRRRGTSRVRARGPLALGAIALAVAGCGATGSSNTSTGVTATGSTLTVFLSDPPAVRSDSALQDAVDGEQLAWAQKVSMVKDASLAEKVLTSNVSDNARSAIANAGLIAYVGEVAGGQSAQTVGITNAEDALELSPTDDVTPTKADFEDEATYGETFASLPIDLRTSPSALETAVPTFLNTFETNFHHAPSDQAIEGYDAVWVLVRVIAGLGHRADDRARIAADVIATLKQNHGQSSVANFSIVTK